MRYRYYIPGICVDPDPEQPLAYAIVDELGLLKACSHEAFLLTPNGWTVFEPDAWKCTPGGFWAFDAENATVIDAD